MALYEFICAHSPHSMKGLFIGLAFVIRGLFEFLGAAALILFAYIRKTIPSCGMDYYIVNIIIGVAGLVLFIYVAKTTS